MQLTCCSRFDSIWKWYTPDSIVRIQRRGCKRLVNVLVYVKVTKRSILTIFTNKTDNYYIDTYFLSKLSTVLFLLSQVLVLLFDDCIISYSVTTLLE